MHLPMRGIHIFEKPYYREIRPMRGRPMRGPPVFDNQQRKIGNRSINCKYFEYYSDISCMWWKL